MRFLQLCKKYPYPIKDGESVAIVHLSRALHRLGGAVSLLAMNTFRHWYAGHAVPEGLGHYERVASVAVDNRIRLWPALRNLFSTRSYHIERFISPHFAQRLRKWLQEHPFDVVLLETIYLTPYIPIIRQYSKALVVLRPHNVESEIWERLSANSSWPQKPYLRLQARRLRRYEQRHINDGDLLAGISDRDVAAFRAWNLDKPTLVLPIGVDLSAYCPDERSFDQPLSLSFIGSLDWPPNVEGLRWFLREVWTPLLLPAFPELTFHIAGRNMPAWLRSLRVPRVQVHGEVPDAATFLNAHSVMVVPLLSGGGMRAKIVEAMALGRVVISTSMGLEGVPARHGQEVWVADYPAAFVEVIRACYQRGEQLVEMGRRARMFCAAHFDDATNAKRLWARCLEVLHSKLTTH